MDVKEREVEDEEEEEEVQALSALTDSQRLLSRSALLTC